jgi:hypothetical protein
VATRVSARTFANESSPCSIDALIRGSSVRARAARTFSRAAPKSMPVRYANQWAHERWPPGSQPRSRSNSAISVRRC